MDDNQKHQLIAWAAGHSFNPTEIDCIIALMLKILDGKCRMSEGSMQSVACLYDQLGPLDGEKLGAAEHGLIATARAQREDDALRMQVYEARLLAETMISRPVMKGFKAMLRIEGMPGF